MSIANDVEVDRGRFAARSKDVAIEGAFTQPRMVRGSIRARTDDARSCGIPAHGKWTARCHLRAAESGEEYSVIGFEHGGHLLAAESGEEYSVVRKGGCGQGKER